MVEYLYLLLNLTLIICAGISLIAWVRLMPAIYRKGLRSFADTWLPVRRRECPFWGFSEIFVMFGTMVVSGQLLLLLAQQKGWFKFPEPGESIVDQPPETLFVTLVISALANCVAVGFVLLWMRNLGRGNLGKFGLSLDRSMLRLGGKAAVMLLPPVLLVAGLVNLWVAEYEHEVLNVLQQLGSPRVFAVLFFGTAIVTPIAEEILFRGLIQGGLQRLADSIGGQVESMEAEMAVQQQSDSEANALMEADEGSGPRRETVGDGSLGAWEPVSYWPVIAASAIFAFMHLGQGAAPIPLFLLSVGLGYLYRQTGSLLPCILVHMLLNGITLLAVLLQ
ncbi:MAG: lysostaphin resistance A-like protein [Rubripirellula sp.]